MNIKLMHGDCLEKMKKIPDNSIDMVLTDPPYGLTACKWDTVIDFELIWSEVMRVCKAPAGILLFGVEPFSSHVRLSNKKMYKYDWVWEKDNGSNFLNTPYQPFKVYEHIHVFSSMASSYSKKGTMSYYPQKSKGKPYRATRKSSNMEFHSDTAGYTTVNNGDRHPRNILRYNLERGLHPTQKPVPLLEYLIKTYTLEGETVLDFTMGSGSTGVACRNLNRNFIGIELDKEYFKIAKERITNGK